MRASERERARAREREREREGTAPRTKPDDRDSEREREERIFDRISRRKEAEEWKEKEGRKEAALESKN